MRILFSLHYKRVTVGVFIIVRGNHLHRVAKIPTHLVNVTSKSGIFNIGIVLFGICIIFHIAVPLDFSCKALLDFTRFECHHRANTIISIEWGFTNDGVTLELLGKVIALVDSILRIGGIKPLWVLLNVLWHIL